MTVVTFSIISFKTKKTLLCVRSENDTAYTKAKPVSTLAAKFKGKYALKYKTQESRDVNCKVSITPIILPKYPNEPLNLVVCRGFGKEPLMLITNLGSDDPRLGVTISKVYLMRWRIEEYCRFKKQGFGFEKFLVRSLDSIRNLDLLLSMAIGYIGTLSRVK